MPFLISLAPHLVGPLPTSFHQNCLPPPWGQGQLSLGVDNLGCRPHLWPISSGGPAPPCRDIVPSWLSLGSPPLHWLGPPFSWPLASELPGVHSLDLLFILIPLVISFNLMALESSTMLMTPKFFSPFLASPLNFRFVYPAAYSASPLGCQIGISYLTCWKLSQVQSLYKDPTRSTLLATHWPIWATWLESPGRVPSGAFALTVSSPWKALPPDIHTANFSFSIFSEPGSSALLWLSLLSLF